MAASGLLKSSPRDAWLVGGSLVYGAALLLAPSVPVVVLGLWWTANTAAHNFLHIPFFASASLNAAYSLYLSLLLGVPQSLWRQRHLAHHADRAVSLTVNRQFAMEGVAVATLWATLAIVSPLFLVTVYFPGWLVGLGLCQLHGYYEHARGTTSHYGRVYNAMFFNDGYHVEHHTWPGVHWTRLPERRRAAATSPWPAVLRWFEAFSLVGLERIVLMSPRLQRLVVNRHERAFRRLVTGEEQVASITIVGGGLFPRTAIIARRLWPQADVTIVDANPAHLEMVRPFVEPGVALRCERFDPTVVADPVDVLIVPLAFVGDREAVYQCRSARTIFVHDWIWANRAPGVVVAWWLLKRLNRYEPSSRSA